MILNRFKKFRTFVFLLVCIPALPFLSAQSEDFARGEKAAASMYVTLAENAIDGGHWSEALIVLERASDYADVSSDISYLLAAVKSRLNQPRGAVIQALRQAIQANNWNKYLPDDALLLEAENLIAVKNYSEALKTLQSVENESPHLARLRLLALRFSPLRDEYLRFTLFILGRYPRESEPARIFLDYLLSGGMTSGGTGSGGPQFSGFMPDETESQILDNILLRLPVLLIDNPELAWMAAPFIRDTQEAARLILAYRAGNVPVPASLLPALNLGLIDETTAVSDLFNTDPDKIYTDKNEPNLDILLLENFYDMLRTQESRDLFKENLDGFTGTITTDANGDGIPESIALYLNGMLSSFSYDEDQDNLPEIAMNFWAGDPQSAAITMPAEESGDPRSKINVRWEKYPAVLDVQLGEERFIPRPLNFYYLPVLFRDFWNLAGTGSAALSGGGILIPEKNALTAALTRRLLIANSVRVERPSQEFKGATEVVELSQSIPVMAREYLDGRMISQTDFLRGRPIGQRVDLDLDGRLETFRHFRRFSLVQDGVMPPAETLLDYKRDYDYAVSDWAGDNNFETTYY
ncbi:MAG: hypothetical protein FWD78_00020 [Treponema sp.]|nr:hypothetical protein [Treponema sp.]